MEDFGLVVSNFWRPRHVVDAVVRVCLSHQLVGVVIATAGITKYLKRQEAGRKEILDLMRRRVPRKQDL